MDEARIKTPDFTICFIVVNDLKLVNDTIGHNTGDEYLKEVCLLSRIILEFQIFFYRLGGNKFSLIFRLCNQTHAEKTLQRIVTDVDLYNIKNSVSYNLSIKFGII